MPIYEYRCSACSHELEALQKISDSPLRKCPECGRLTLRRLMSAPSFRLKGGGWYETDFKGNGEKKRNLVETSGGESSASSTSADATKSDAAAKSTDAPAKDAAKDAKKPAEKPAASDVKKPRNTRTAKSART
ncbi:MAG TPA: zinc ribbon domain-containing protein [Gammaproteobacteria bacterium]|nr:zinc ribbon domain-containing protein [Gammaproteobacteria bacterium]